MTKTRKMVILSLFLAIAIILNIVENVSFTSFIVPGIKLGLANISMIFILYFFGYKEMITINILRVIVASLISGQLFGMPFVISMVSSLTCMIAIYPIFKTNIFSIYGISMIQAMIFNIAQISTVSFLYDSTVFFYYLPYLMISGIITGYLVAFCATYIIKMMNSHIKIA